MKKMMNVAILGAGGIAAMMASTLSALTEEVCMYAIASRTLDKAVAFQKKWGFEKAYGSYEELAKDDQVDLIYVATPHSEHYDNTLLCLTNGRNCLVEKAFCANTKQAKQLIEIAREHNVFLAEAMWTRYQPSKDKIRELIEQGVIGKIQSLESEFSLNLTHVERLMQPDLAGGALLDLGIYPLTVAAMYTDYPICQVTVEAQMTDTGVDGCDVITFQYDNGVTSRIKCCLSGPEVNRSKLTGNKGYMIFGPTNAPEKVEIYNLKDELVQTVELAYQVNGYEYEVLECLRMIKEGKKETESMPLTETIRLMSWMDSIRYSYQLIYPFENPSDLMANALPIS